MRRREVLDSLARLLTAQDLVVAWRSSTWEDWRSIAPGEGRTTLPLVILGSISSTALGLAIALPHRRVVAIESDGSALMNTGIMATIGAQRPHNLTVVVLDNGMYESVGGPPTLTTFSTDLARMAAGAGCVNCTSVLEIDDFMTTAQRYLDDDEVGYLVARIQPDLEQAGASRKAADALPRATDGVEDKYRFIRAIEELEGIQIHPDPGPKLAVPRR